MKTFPSVEQTGPSRRTTASLPLPTLHGLSHKARLWLTTTLTAALLLLGTGGIAQAVFFELSAAPGNQASNTGTASSPNFSPPILTRGSGLTAAAGAGSMNSSGWFSSSAPTTLGDAIANEDYYEFTVSSLNCLFFNPTTINIVLRSSATGPNTATLRSSADGFSSDIGTVTVTTTSTEYSFSDAITPNNLSTSFRIYGYGGAAGGGTPAAGGTMRIGTSVNAADNDIEVFATSTNLTVTQVANITVTEGDNVPITSLVPNVPGATINWSRTAEDIASFPELPTNGTGDIPSFTADNDSNGPLTSTFTVTATVQGCTSVNMVFTITVLSGCDFGETNFSGNTGPCNDNGTPNDPSDDFFEKDVRVTFTFPPSTGFLQIVPGGDQIGTYQVHKNDIVGLQHIFTNVKFKADGTQTEVQVNWTDEPACIADVTGTLVVQPCSTAPPSCEIIGFSFNNIGPCNDNGTPNDDTDDYFIVSVDVLFSNTHTNASLILLGTDIVTPAFVAAPIGTNLTHTFTIVQMSADGQITDFNGMIIDSSPPNTTFCSLPGTGPAVGECSNGGGPACEVIGFTFDNISGCNNNGTPNDASDDFFTCDMSLIYSNPFTNSVVALLGPPPLLAVPGNGAPAGIGSNLTHVFQNVKFRANGQPVTFNGAVEHPQGTACSTLPGTGPAVNPCPCPQVTFGSGAPNQTVECNGSGNTAQFNAWLAAGGFANVNPSSGTITSITHGTPVVQNNCGNTKTFTVLFTFTNDCGNSANISGVFTIADNTAPVITSGTIGSCYPTAAAAQAAALAATTAVDVCGGTITFNAIASGTCTAIVTVTASDLCGNSTSHTYATRIDNTPPTITCAAQTTPIECPATPVFTPPTATDNCPGNVTINFGDVTVQGACPGTFTTTRTWTATDPCGNTATCARSITVRDVTPPPVPANGASQVACPALAIAPVPPVVIDACAGAITPTGPVVTNNPNPLTCEGTRTFTFTYRDCSGNTSLWSHVTTIEREPFTIPVPNGSATVDCPDDTDTAPIPPVVTSNCGEVLTPVLINTTAKPGCEGHRVYTFRYTDCEGNFADWLFTYRVEYQDFAVPPSELESVECPILATEPVPPVVFDNCGKLLTPIGPAVASSTNTQGCEGSRSYSWTYKDCEGNTHVWSKTYQFLYSADFEVFSDETNVVACISYAVEPFPPTFYDACGNEVKVALTGFSEDIAPGGCTGWRRYDFTYTNCGGHTRPWSFTYEINDNEAPLGVCPSGNGGTSNGNTPMTINVTNLSCIEEVPCPDDYDFSEKIAELLMVGDFFDVCSGNDLVVELQSASDLWECADPDGDGQFTFGRTFYFRIADPCGNEYPGGCDVTYSGKCLPIETFRQEDWGIAGGAPGSFMNTSDLIIIEDMLAYGPVVVGGPNRSLSITQPQCIIDLLPGTGGPSVLANCHQTNCTGSNGSACNPMGIGGIKNSLAANAIALSLNLRFNAEYKGLNMNDLRNENLGCIEVHNCIVNCSATDCHLQVFDGTGTLHEFSYTLGGLLDLANLYLDGGLGLSIGQQSIYGTAINQALLNVNDHWNEGQMATACGPDVSSSQSVAPKGQTGNKIMLSNNIGGAAIGAKDADLGIGLAPNPATREVVLKLSALDEPQAVTLAIFNQLGQQLLRKDFGQVASLSEAISLDGFEDGLYLGIIKVGARQVGQKLVVSKN
jgi:hypothetical protein